METLKEKTTRGLFWGGMNNVVQQGLGLLFGIILGRLLNPEDYGMIAMILVFQLIANALQESGFKSAIGNLKEPQHNDYNSVFWFNIIVGITCYVILFFVAPLIADYYHTPELVLLCRVAFLTIIFAALGTAQSAYLFRNMMVKEQAKCNMTATLLSSIIGVTLAFLKCGYWALAIQSMAYIGLNSLLSMAAKRGTKRVLYISSSEVYGQKEGMEPYFENDYGYLDILNQRASYPSSKRASETLCVAYSMEYGMDTVIARPGHIYGPGVTPFDNRATAQFTRNAVKGEDIVMKSAGSQLRSYCYSLDCATALLAILLSGESQNAYNISNPNSIITISQIAKCIADAAGTQLTYENPDDAEAAGYNLMSNSSLDSKKLESLGWAAEFSPEEGADRCVRFYG